MAVEIKATACEVWQGFDGTKLIFQSDRKLTDNELNEISSGKPLRLTVKEYRKKRSLDANAYAWVLIDQISALTGVSKARVYRDTIRDIAGVSEAICVSAAAADKFAEVWESRGLGWQTEIVPSKIPNCVTIFAYYGSSEYDTAQMARLIDHLQQDLLAVGGEPMPADYVDGLLRGWANG